MHFKIKTFFISLFLPGILAFAEPIIVDLKDPTYSDGVLRTECGGVLKTDCLRIQAQKIAYCQSQNETEKNCKLTAQGNVMVLSGSKLFLGEKIEYDFISKSGVIQNGRLITDPWFSGGKTIFLHNNGCFSICDAYLTTCEEEDCDFYIKASQVNVKCNEFADLKDIRFCIYKIPFLWLPKYRVNLNDVDGIPLRFRVSTGGYRGTKFTAKYKVFSSEDWQAYLRLDFTLARGLGGGLETENCTSTRNFRTRSYMAQDVSYDDPQKRLRYRFHGIYDECFTEENIKAHLRYDILSDSEMASDYTYKGFELPTGQRTELYLTKTAPRFISDISARVKVNNFQTINQQLPSYQGFYHPITLGCTGIITENRVKAQYLSYSYSNGTPDVTNFSSSRIELNPRIYRPFYTGPLTITPEAGFLGVFYGNNPKEDCVYQAIGQFSLDINTHFYRIYKNFKHILKPYVQYQLFTSPSTSFNDQYVFDINDGFSYLNQMHFGIKSQIYRKDSCGTPFSWMEMNLWADAFFKTPTVLEAIPKIYASLKWKVFPFLTTSVGIAWNNTESRPDYSNLAVAWTFSENFAINTEYLARGPRYWRKADATNFILDSFRSVNELELTPLSDRRNTFLTHIYFRFHPNWTVELKTRNGWNRRNQPSYFEYKTTLSAALKCSWKLKGTYEHRTNEDRYTLGISLGRHIPNLN